MSVTVLADVKLNRNIFALVEKDIDKNLGSMAEDIVKLSQRYAPVETSELVTSHRVDREKSTTTTSYYISANTPYARRRHFENRKNPQTRRYLERAGDQVVKNPQRYFR